MYDIGQRMGIEMNKLEVLWHSLLKDIYDQIESIVDNSDFMTRRVLVTFKNGYQLSVIYGSFTYGSDLGLFEIAIFNPAGEFDTSFFNDQVLGYQSKEDVVRWMVLVAQK